MSVDPYEEILFAVQTIKAGQNQGIRFYLRSSPKDASGTYVNINIPKNSGELYLKLDQVFKIIFKIFECIYTTVSKSIDKNNLVDMG